MGNSSPCRMVFFSLAAAVAVAVAGCGGSGIESEELVGAPDVPGPTSVDSLSGQTLFNGAEIDAVEAANLRTGPSAKDAILLVIPSGESARIVEGTPQNGFYRVSYADREGWTFGEHFRVSQIGEASSALNVADILYRAKTSVGFSYWWGHGAWSPDHPNKGSCSGSCPNCSHSGPYGSDCSGMVAKAFVAPSSNLDLAADSHPYHSSAWTASNAYWTVVSRGTARAGDAFGHNGHVYIYEAADPWNSHLAIECKGCSYGCVRGYRTAASDYVVTRRNGLSNAGTPPACGTMRNGSALAPGQSLKSCNGAATLVHQTDGNVVLYDRLGALWATGTNGRATSTFTMQTDGNLVLYSPTPAAIWHTNTDGNTNAFFRVQDDCHLVMYSTGGLVLWKSNTFCR